MLWVRSRTSAGAKGRQDSLQSLLCIAIAAMLAGANHLIAILHDAVITGDALFTQKVICRHIRDRRGHYLFAVKDNPRQLPALMASANEKTRSPNVRRSSPQGLPDHALPPDLARAETGEKAHGRIEIRKSAVSSEVVVPSMDQARRPARASNRIAARPDATASKSPLGSPVCRQKQLIPKACWRSIALSIAPIRPSKTGCTMQAT
jgi:hypothetical protein